MKYLPIFTFLLISTSLLGRKIKVNVTFQNLTNETLLINLNVGSNIADPSATVLISKKVTPGDFQWTFETEKTIKNYSVVFGSAIILKNDLPAGKLTGKAKVVSVRDNNYSWDIEIDKSNRRSLSSLADQILQYQPQEFINKDASPKPIAGLFNQYLGGLQAYRITTKGDTVFEYRVAPIDLGLNAKVGEIKGAQTSNKQIDFSSSVDQAVKVSIPAITELGIGFEHDRMHSIKLEYKDIGVIDWIKTSSMSEKQTAAIFKDDMAVTDQMELGRLSTIYGDSLRLQQIDKAYIFDGLYLEHKEGVKVIADNDIRFSTFVTNSGTFEFSNSNTTSKVFGSSYLGYWIGNTSPNYGGLLKYFEAVYSAQITILLNDNQLLDEFQKLREQNPNLPNLREPSEIRSYYNNQLQKYLQNNSEEKSNRLFQSNNPTNPDNSSWDMMNQSDAIKLMDDAKLEYNFIPNRLEGGEAIELIKKIESVDPFFKEKIKRRPSKNN